MEPAQDDGTSAVTRCLRVPELQHIICDMIRSYLDGLPTLAALACTARVFSEVALDTLWNTQSSLVPLIKCFPANVWEETQDDDDGFRAVTLKAEPNVDDWTRVKLYASRIRVIHLGAPPPGLLRYTGKMMGDAAIVLRKSLGSFPLLPNLQLLKWGQVLVNEAQDLALLQLLLSPSLSLVDVVMKEWSNESAQAVAFTLSEYRKSATQLRSVTFSLPPCATIEAAVRDLGYHQQSLHNMPPEFVAHLSESHSLQRVSIKVDRETTIQILEKARATNGSFFPSLRHISLHIETLKLCEEWLEAVRSPMLDSLALVIDEPAPATALQSFFEGLVQRRLHSGSVHKLRFVSTKAASRMSTKHHITPTTLESLLQLDLTTLQLEPGAPIDVDNAFIERAACAWPNLRTLELGAELRRYNASPRVTLEGLLPLAEHCINLTALALPFMTDASAFRERFDAGKRPVKGLSFGCGPFVLGVGGATINAGSDTFLFSAVVSDLCPGLRSVQTAWGRAGKIERGDLSVGDLDREDRTIEDKWRQIDRFASEMARVRRQERMWVE
ncbi:hypothetical protein C2E23DRAFT_829196 [Lenzites betulinus]|nr:hypothetical protein C2E23DRAFT_829196 [Lenzites betulinus]